MRKLEMEGDFESQTQGKKNIVEAMKATAEQLGNTPSICRKCYVHPGVLDAYLDHSLFGFLRQFHDRERKEVRDGLKSKETRVLAFLHQLSAD